MSQQVILLSDVPGLGQLGDVRKVKDGFARNFLIPQRLAVFATPNDMRKFEKQKEKIAQLREQQLTSAQSAGDKLSKIGLVFERPVGPGGRLFGSVTSLDIVTELAKQGAVVEKKSVLIDSSLKTLGDHIVKIRIHSKVMVDVPVKINGIETKQSTVAVEEINPDDYAKADDDY